jgi:hypothetical protein
VLGAQAEVGVFPRHVAGVDVIVFVPGNGVAPSREVELKKKDGEECSDAGGGESAKARR